MPPKAARGRGRGRGRGAAPTSTSRTPIEIDSASPSPAPPAPTTTTQPPDTTTTLPEPSTSIPTTTTSTTTRTRTTTSTAPIPAPTPNPTTRAPSGIQRLHSLKKRPPPGSLIPLNADGSTPKPTLRYQPRAVVRRSKEEREAMERLEKERNAERIAEAKAVRGGGGRGRGGRDRGGRGRGRGRGGSFVGGEVGGPLGSGSGVSMRGRGSGGYGGYGGGGGGKGKYGRAAAGGRGKMTGFVGGKGEGEYAGGSGDVSSDEGSDSAPRFSIEQINIISDEEEEGMGGEDGEFEGKGKGKGKMPARASVGGGVGARGLRPVRVERHEHQERSVGVNTEASSNKSAELRKQAKSKAKQGEDDSLFVQDDEAEEGDDEGDVEMVSERAVRGGGRAAGDGEIRIKEEPTDGDVLMTDSIPQATDDAAIAPKPTPKKKKRVTIKDPRSKLQTEEEKQEYDRHEQDIEHIKKALGTLTTLEKTPADGEAAADQAEEGEAKTEEPKDERSGRLFLIQFPPMTPNLIVPTQPGDEMDQDTVEAVPPPPGQAQTQAQPGIPSIKKENAIDGLPQPTAAANDIPPLITATNSNLPAGRVGTLNIHQSGRATIDWGGISFELTKGSDVEFLQDAVVASESKPLGGSGSPTEGGVDRQIWAMSQVSGKFVVTPDWEKMLE
ncbi:hypothetical protein FQN50_003011 [Emmonsiellopsis sp. PD_5]|nr:hypothetical protein FQN50_003011 [Emmonsiellopsis sp. PD_5]